MNSLWDTRIFLGLVPKESRCTFHFRRFGKKENIQKAAMSFVMSVRLSVRMGQFGSHKTDFHEIWYLVIFRKPVQKIQVSLKTDTNNVYFTWRPRHILGTCAKLRKATVRFVISVRLSIRMEQPRSNWTHTHEILYTSIFRKYEEKIQDSLQSQNYNRHFTWKPIYIFDNISLISSKKEKCARQKVYRKSKHAFYFQ